MKKKVISLCLVVALVAIAVIGGTLAYFTDTTGPKDNVFTVGNVNIVLTETKWDAEADHDDVYPGEALAKNPVVANVSDDGNTISDNPCFVRVKVTGLDCLGAENMITYETGYEKDKLGEGWVLAEDGYFYYTKVLGGVYQVENEGLDYKTTELFQQIRIPTSVTNGFDGTYDVQVSAEAVQAQGAKPSWNDVKTMELADIQAWFTTCMAK